MSRRANWRAAAIGLLLLALAWVKFAFATPDTLWLHDGGRQSFDWTIAYEPSFEERCDWQRRSSGCSGSGEGTWNRSVRLVPSPGPIGQLREILGLGSSNASPRAYRQTDRSVTIDGETWFEMARDPDWEDRGGFNG